MISISKSALELVINRISSIEKSVSSLETELIDIKTVFEQWMSLSPEPADEKQNNREQNETAKNSNKIIRTEWENFEVDGNGFIRINPHTSYLNYFANDKNNKQDVNITQKPKTCDASSQTDTKDSKVEDEYIVCVLDSTLENQVNEILDDSVKILPIETKTPELVEYVDLTRDESQYVFNLDDYVDELLDNNLEIKPPDPKTVPDCIEYIDLTVDDGSETEVIIIKSKTSESKAILHVDENNFTIDTDGFVWVYTDGSYYTDGRGGIGVWFGFAHPLNISKSVKVDNSGKTEILACIEAVKQAHVNNIKKLCVNSDYIRIVQHMQGKGNMKPGTFETEKRELIEANKLLEVKYRYVKGHSGIKGNIEADKLARQAAKNMIIDWNNNPNGTQTRNTIVKSVQKQQDQILKIKGYILDSDGCVKVFIKGVRCLNHKIAAVAVWFNNQHSSNIEEVLEHSSNLDYEPDGYNGAEVIACNRAILRAHAVGIKRLCIYSDSENTLKNIKQRIRDTEQNIKTELYDLDKSMKLIPCLNWTHTKGEKGNLKAFHMANKYALLNEQIQNLATTSRLNEINSVTSEISNNLIQDTIFRTLKETDSTTNDNKSLQLLNSVIKCSLKRKVSPSEKVRKKRKLNNSTVQNVED